MSKLKLLLVCVGLIIAASSSAQRQQNLVPFQEKVKTAMALDFRTEADTKRDRNLDPIRALDFWVMKGDMKVVEFAPLVVGIPRF